MATFFMYGKYSSEAIEKMSSDRTKKAITLIKKTGGEIKAAYALLGEQDLVIIVDFSDIKQVMKTSVALSKLTDISFTTSPAVSIEEFDKIIADI